MSSRHHRRLAALAALALAASMALGAGPPVGAASGADWPQARGASTHRGWNSNETTITKSNVKNLKVGWGGWGIVNASPTFEPVVVGSTVYVTAEDADYGARLTAKRVDNLAKLWSFEVFGQPAGPPAIVSGRLFFLVSSTLYAFNASTGVKLWQRDVGPADGFLAAEGNLVVTASRALASTGDSSVQLKIWNATTGALKGSATTGDNDAFGHSGPTVRNGITFVIGNGTYAFTSSGARWSSWKGSASIGDAPALPVAAPDLNYGVGQYLLRASNATTGYTAWKAGPTAGEADWRHVANLWWPGELEKGPYELAVDGSRAYLAYQTKAGAGYLTAFNRSTGARIWSKALTVMGPPTVANGVVFVSLGANGLGAFDAGNGNQLWRDTAHTVVGPVTVANGRVYAYGWTPSSSSQGVLMFQL